MAASRATLEEEVPDAYTDVGEVVSTITGADITRPVARLRPITMVRD